MKTLLLAIAFVSILSLTSAWNFQGEFASVTVNLTNTYQNITVGSMTNASYVPYNNTLNNVNLNNFNLTNVNNLSVNNLLVQGNVSIKRPYAMYSDMNIQTVGSINTAYNMTFNVTEDDYLFTKNINNYTFSVQQSGDYEIILSVIAQATTPGSRVYVWARKNNVDIPRSTTIYDFKSSNANAVIAVPFIIDLTPSDTFSIQYAADNTGVKIISFNKTAFAPETPGAIMTISKLSEITP